MNDFFNFIKPKKLGIEIPSVLLKFDINNQQFMIFERGIEGFNYPNEENCKDYTKIFVIKDNPQNTFKTKYYVLIFLFDKDTHQPIELNDKLSERYKCKNKLTNRTYCEKKCKLIKNELFSTYSFNGKNFIYFTRTLQDYNDKLTQKEQEYKITISTNDVFLDPVESKKKLNEELNIIVNPQPQSTNIRNPLVINLRNTSTNLTTPNNPSRQSTSTVNSSALTENLSKTTTKSKNTTQSTTSRIERLQELEAIWMKPINVTLDVKIKLENKNHPNKNKKEKALQFIINAIKEQNPLIYIFLLKCNLLYGKNIKIQLNYLGSTNFNKNLTNNVLTENILNSVIFIIDDVKIKYKELKDLLNKNKNKNLTFNKLKQNINSKPKITTTSRSLNSLSTKHVISQQPVIQKPKGFFNRMFRR